MSLLNSSTLGTCSRSGAAESCFYRHQMGCGKVQLMAFKGSGRATMQTWSNDQLARSADAAVPVHFVLNSKICSRGSKRLSDFDRLIRACMKCSLALLGRWLAFYTHGSFIYLYIEMYRYKNLLFFFWGGGGLAKSVKAFLMVQREKECFTYMLLVVYWSLTLPNCQHVLIHQFILS